MAANQKGSLKIKAAPQSAAAASEGVGPRAQKGSRKTKAALRAQRQRAKARSPARKTQNHGGSSVNPGMRLPGYTSEKQHPNKCDATKAQSKKKSQATTKKTLNPKRVMTGWSRGGSLALARRAAPKPLGRGATLPCGNPKP